MQITPASPVVLSERGISLEERYGNKFVNDVFRDNILLTILYMKGEIKTREAISWDKVNRPFTYKFELAPNQTFAFHDGVAAQYDGKVVKTTNAHFNAQEGFRSDGYLFGDGVCHLASLIYWAAKDAGLEAIAPTNHNFAKIPQVPAEYGVSIYSNPGNDATSAAQNLYITNNKDKPVSFVFEYKNNDLKVDVVEVN